MRALPHAFSLPNQPHPLRSNPIQISDTDINALNALDSSISYFKVTCGNYQRQVYRAAGYTSTRSRTHRHGIRSHLLPHPGSPPCETMRYPHQRDHGWSSAHSHEACAPFLQRRAGNWTETMTVSWTARRIGPATSSLTTQQWTSLGRLRAAARPTTWIGAPRAGAIIPTLGGGVNLEPCGSTKVLSVEPILCLNMMPCPGPS